MLFKAHLQPLDITCLIRAGVARGAHRDVARRLRVRK
jgi:hypothetical protein